MNTASEYGFGGVIAALPGFLVIAGAEGHSQSTCERSDHRDSACRDHGLGLGRHEHRACCHGRPVHLQPRTRPAFHLKFCIASPSMASGGMDTLPHNGAVITLLAVTGLTHKQSYRDIFVITCIKTLAVFVVIAVYYVTGIV